MMKRSFSLLTLWAMLASFFLLAQSQPSLLAEDQKGFYAIVRDGQGEAVEGFLRLNSDELTVQTKEEQEEVILLGYIKSITLEKVKSAIPGEDFKKEAAYSVRVENSQEIYALRKKYSFSLNTNVGVVTRTIDPEMVNNFF